MSASMHYVVANSLHHVRGITKLDETRRGYGADGLAAPQEFLKN